MKLFRTTKTIRRLNQMVDHAIAGEPVESGFDESRLSALETKLAHFLESNAATKTQLAEEKAKIGELISDISHQTKTPLSNILLYTQLLAESDLPEPERQYLLLLTQQAEKLNFLISSLIKTSRLETGMIALSPRVGRVADLLATVMQDTTLKAAKKEIILTATSEDEEAIFDPKWTAEALRNIVDNAIKYTNVGGSVTLSVTAYSLFCRIDIADTGIGIAEWEIAKIFSRFYRSPTVSDEEGVGIGLYLAREILSAGGGYVKVQSTLGKGSIFSVFLPMEK